MRKIVIALFILTLSAFTLVACMGERSRSEIDSAKDLPIVRLWSFTNEMENIINNHFLIAHPELDFVIDVTLIGSDDFEQALDPVLGTHNAPDIIAMESAFVRKYVESGMLVDLTQFDIDYNHTVSYVVDVGTDLDGKLVALSHQTTPGAFFYRTSMAYEFLGVTSPAQMQQRVSTFDGFLETAREIQVASNGEVYMIASLHDLLKPFLGQRDNGWVVDNTLVIDDSLADLLTLSRLMIEEELTMNAEGQGEAWFAGMGGNEIFGYNLPTWAMHFWLTPNAGDTMGDWSMTQGPTSWFWGGTWLAITETSDYQAKSARFIEFVTTNESFMFDWASAQGDVVSNINVVEQVRDNFENELLGGQNHYDYFADMILTIDGSILTAYDQTIEALFLEHALTTYAEGELTMQEAFDNFRQHVGNLYPNMIIN